MKFLSWNTRELGLKNQRSLPRKIKISNPDMIFIHELNTSVEKMEETKNRIWSQAKAISKTVQEEQGAYQFGST